MIEIIKTSLEALAAIGLLFWTAEFIFYVVAGTIKTAKNAVRKINS